MTFNNQNSSLKFLTRIPPNRLKIYPKSCDDAIQFVVDRLAQFRPAFRERIQYTGVPFIMESHTGFHRLTSILPHEPIVQSGTWITLFKDNLWTFFYQLDLQPGSEVRWEGKLTVLVASNHKTFKAAPQIAINCRQIWGITVDQYGRLKSDMDLPLIVVNLLNLIMFDRYYGWQRKVIPAGKKATLLNMEYSNETNFPIEVTDSAWFTQLMRDKAFSEGSRGEGFFRIQRCGPGLTRKKLVWVTPG